MLAAQKQLASEDEPQMFKVSPSICVLAAGVCTSSGGPVNKDKYSEGKNAGRDAMHYPGLGSWQNKTKMPFKAHNYEDVNNYKKLSKEQSMLK